jgi:hypothetical protein
LDHELGPEQTDVIQAPPDQSPGLAPLADIPFEFWSDSLFSQSSSLGLAASRQSSILHEPEFPVVEDQALDLIQAYIAEAATWCETTDERQHFSKVCAHNMLENKLFKAAGLALASRQLNMTGSLGEDVALRCYQYAIQLLIQRHPDGADAYYLASCTLLCVYEMMASDVIDWRRHLKVQSVGESKLDEADETRRRAVQACSCPLVGTGRVWDW